MDSSLLDDQFAECLFRQLAKEEQRATPGVVESLLAEHYLSLSEQLDRSAIQHATSVRNCLRVRQLATLLIEEDGHLRRDRLGRAIDWLVHHLYSLGPNRHLDALGQIHLVGALARLQQDHALWSEFQRIAAPNQNRVADRLICATLAIPFESRISNAHARRAALSAWLTYLRQNVGSCFATAPAIVVHEEQPLQLIVDLRDLLNLGQMSRVIEGRHHSVPLSPSWGMADLRLPLFLPLDLERLALSPGMMQALLAAGVIDAKLSVEERGDQLRALLVRVVEQGLTGRTDPDQVIQTLLREQLGGAKEVSSYREALDRARSAFKILSDNALLKSWEFCLASLSDVRSEHNRWNLFQSLGVRHDEPGGVGVAAYQAIQERLDRVNRELEILDNGFERSYVTYQMAIRRLQSASSSQEAQWLRMEVSRREQELRAVEDERIEFQRRGEGLTHLFVQLMNRYIELFASYFQEVYDPEMHQVERSPYDDSPAGFRLLCKYGRANPSLWTPIDSADDFLDALVDFFVATEPEITHDPEFSRVKEDLPYIVSSMIGHLKAPGFLEGTLRRMGRAQGEAIARPWAYTSGGSMESLVRHYFPGVDQVERKGRAASTPTDLFVTLLDTLKDEPPSVMRPYLDHPVRSMLAQSPTHAFVAKPGLPPFRDGWMDEGNTYTWVRDQVILPQKRFLEGIRLDKEMVEWLSRELSKRCRVSLSTPLTGEWSPSAFRAMVLEGFQRGRTSDETPYEEVVDSLLFRSLPLIHERDLRERLREVMRLAYPAEEYGELIDQLLPARVGGRVRSAEEVQEICLGLVMRKTKRPTASYDVAWHLREAMRQCGLALPAPVVWADTNWVDNYFAFLVNPGTGELDLWRVDYIGSQGAPMSRWRQWFTGSAPDEWLLYTKPQQYTSLR